MYSLFLFHSKIAYANAFQCYVIHTLSLLFIIEKEDTYCVVRVECYIRFFRFDPSLVCVGFVVDLLALGEVVLPVLRLLFVNTIAPYSSLSASSFTSRTNVRS